MNGHIIPGTPIAVDFWKKRDCPSAKFFFLTHLHGDHTVGLSSSWQYNIYCSEITAKLLIEKYGLKEQLINILEVGSSNIIYMDEEKQEQLVVSVICANHCPGSVMFLFEGYFGKVLYTGDFRYCESMFIDTPLSNCSNIDVLYLDNTYCSPECIFPTREDSIKNIISLIKQHPEHRIIIGMRNLGKENLLVKIAEETKEWISVPSSIYKTAEILGLPNVFCVDDMDCKIRIVPFHTVTRKNAIEWDEFEPTLVILPSALYTGLDGTPYQDTPYIHIIPYSDHSSYGEICSFVKNVKPKFIQPVVNERPRGGIFGKLSERSDMSCLNKFLSKEPSVKFNIPPSVKKFMSVPMSAHMSKMSKPKKHTRLKLQMKKRSSVSLGVVYDSPSKLGLSDSCQKFEKRLEEMKGSFPIGKNNVDKEKNDKELGYEEFKQHLLKSSTQSNVENLQENQSMVNLYKNVISPVTLATVSNNKQTVYENVNDKCCTSKHIEKSKAENICLSDKTNSTSNSSEEAATHTFILNHKNINIKQNSLDKWVQRSPSVTESISHIKKTHSTKKSSRKLQLDEGSTCTHISKNEYKNSSSPLTQTICINNGTTKYDMNNLYNNNVLASAKVKLFPLKPINMKRSMSLDIGMIAIKPLKKDTENPVPLNKGKRHANDDINTIPIKRARTVF